MKIAENLKNAALSLAERHTERKRLRGPVDLSYAIADSLSMLDRAAWSRVTSDAGIFLSPGYLTMLERVLPKNLSVRYALIYRKSGEEYEPVAAVYMQIADISLAQARPAKSAAQATQLDRLAEATRQRVLTCGNLLTYGQHGVAFAESLDPKLGWHGVAEVLYRVRQAEKLAGRTHFIMIKDLHSEFSQQAAHLKNLSYRYVETEPNMVLSLHEDWKSYDDYLASLASKYRSGVRNAILGPIEDSGCTVERLEDVGTMQERMFFLYKSVQLNAGFRPFELVPEYFSALQRAAGDSFRCSVLKRGDNVLGFLISVADGKSSIAYHIGFDREAAAGLPIYLRLLHAGIADAISMGCKQVAYGRTALEPKAALGAKPQAFGVLVRHRQPILNKAIKHLLLSIEHDDAPDRSPFKKSAAKDAAAVRQST